MLPVETCRNSNAAQMKPADAFAELEEELARTRSPFQAFMDRARLGVHRYSPQPDGKLLFM
jgi:hypothetical protein